MKGLHGQCVSSLLLELSIFAASNEGPSLVKVKDFQNIFTILLLLQLRSATVVIAYLMMKQNMTCKQALDVISQGRKVRPNPGFLQQLAELEHTLR